MGNMKRLKANTALVSLNGPPCPRCEHPMQIHKHIKITEKHLRAVCYYTRWYRCLNPKCRTTLVMPKHFKVWNHPPEVKKRIMAIANQLKPQSKQ